MAFTRKPMASRALSINCLREDAPFIVVIIYKKQSWLPVVNIYSEDIDIPVYTSCSSAKWRKTKMFRPRCFVLPSGRAARVTFWRVFFPSRQGRLEGLTVPHMGRCIPRLGSCTSPGAGYACAGATEGRGPGRSR